MKETARAGWLRLLHVLSEPEVDALDVGDELREGGRRYTVERVESPPNPNPNALGHVWALLVE